MRMRNKLYKYWTPHVRRGSFLWRLRRLYWIHVSKKYYALIEKGIIKEDNGHENDWGYSNNYVTTRKR